MIFRSSCSVGCNGSSCSCVSIFGQAASEISQSDEATAVAYSRKCSQPFGHMPSIRSCSKSLPRPIPLLPASTSGGEMKSVDNVFRGVERIVMVNFPMLSGKSWRKCGLVGSGEWHLRVTDNIKRCWFPSAKRRCESLRYRHGPSPYQSDWASCGSQA